MYYRLSSPSVGTGSVIGYRQRQLRALSPKLPEMPSESLKDWSQTILIKPELAVQRERINYLQSLLKNTKKSF